MTKVEENGLLLSSLKPSDTLDRVEQALWVTASKVAEEWIRYQQTRSPFTRYYLYFKRSGPGLPGDVKIFDENEVAAGYELADPERITSLVPYTLTAWIYERMRRLPILPT